MIKFKATKEGIDIFSNSRWVERLTPTEVYQLHVVINEALRNWHDLTGKKIDESHCK